MCKGQRRHVLEVTLEITGLIFSHVNKHVGQRNVLVQSVLCLEQTGPLTLHILLDSGKKYINTAEFSMEVNIHLPAPRTPF